MRRYQLREYTKVPAESAVISPGFRLSEVIDQFYAEGVVPDFLPADLGEDNAEEFDDDGLPVVDPLGDIRSDPMELREAALVHGIEEYESTLSPTPSTPSVLVSPLLSDPAVNADCDNQKNRDTI